MEILPKDATVFGARAQHDDLRIFEDCCSAALEVHLESLLPLTPSPTTHRLSHTNIQLGTYW